MEEAVAFSPAHVTGFFQICDEPEDPLHKGSVGAGFSMRRGVKTSVKIREAGKNSIKVKINGYEAEDAETSRRVVELFFEKFGLRQRYEILVEHEVSLPIGMGFGTSGAGALSLALALNEALGLGLSKIEAAQIAHVAEVECRTGLGTVLAETFGGVEVRVKPGAPGIGEVRNIKLDGDYVFACIPFAPYSTKRALIELRHKINATGGRLMRQLLMDPTVENLMALSRRFVEKVGLISRRAREVLNELDKDGILGSVPVFGDAVFTLIPRDLIKEVERIFAKHSSNVLISELDFEGARIING